MRLYELSLYSVAAWVVLSLLHVPALVPLSTILWILGLLIVSKQVIGLRQTRATSFSWLSSIFILIYASIACLWLKDLWATPSNDDTINHLYYLQTILEQKTCLLGQTTKPGKDFFGTAVNHFYPTGAHAWIALWLLPLNLVGLSIPAGLQLVMFVMLILWPFLIWRGIRKLAPDNSEPMQIFLLASTLTLPLFPLWPLGEGGVSRIIALVLFTPLWFRAIHGQVGGFRWTAIFAPIFLFIHPSLLPFIGLALLFFDKRNLLWSLSGLPIGGLLFYLIVHSGAQEIFQTNFSPSFHGWFDRLKGPFHFWFSDPYGFGKFLSPKNFLTYFAIFLLILRKIPLKLGLLFLCPFILAAMAYIPFLGAQNISLIYYHSVKRIAEVLPLIGLTLACFAAPHAVSVERRSKWALIVLSIVFLSIFAKNSSESLQKYHELYHSKMAKEIQTGLDQLKLVDYRAMIINDDHEFDWIRYQTNRKVFNFWAECSKLEKTTEYCIRRLAFVSELQTRGTPAGTQGIEIWWIPPDGVLPGSSKQEVSLTTNKKIYRIL
jgi:hypothetical protein